MKKRIALTLLLAGTSLLALPAADQSTSARIVLVSAINPTRAGEGKTTVAIGLGQGLQRLGRRTAIAAST